MQEIKTIKKSKMLLEDVLEPLDAPSKHLFFRYILWALLRYYYIKIFVKFCGDMFFQGITKELSLKGVPKLG